MKKILSIFTACVVLFCLAACSNETLSEGSQQSDQPDEAHETDGLGGSDGQNGRGGADSGSDDSEAEALKGNALVVYFSATGTTQSVAEMLAGMQGIGLYEIMPEQPYTDEDLNYNDPTTRASVEQNDGAARPAISGGIDHIEDYDVIYVGFPIWWGDMPRILYTFFDIYDLSGKTIAPFCTSGSSGISQAVQAIRELEPSATVTDGLRTSTGAAENDLAEWLSNIGLAE